MNEIPADFAFKDYATLESIEEGMRAVESNLKIGIAILAISLGRIKRDSLYIKVAPDFKAYIAQERTNLKYRKALHLAAIGENFWKFRPQLKDNGIRLSENMSKVRLLDFDIVQSDPMFWDRFKALSVRELDGYIKRRRNETNVYPEFRKNSKVTVTVSGATLSIDEVKVKGVNINQFRKEVSLGKRAVVFWVEDDNEARKIQRLVDTKLTKK